MPSQPSGASGRSRVTVLDPAHLPERFESVEALEEFLSRPSQALIDDLAQVDGDLMILGAYTAFGLYSAFQLNPLLSLPVTVVLLFLLGWTSLFQPLSL